MVVVFRLTILTLFMISGVETGQLKDWFKGYGENQPKDYAKSWYDDGPYGGNKIQSGKAYKTVKREHSIYDERPCHFQSFETFLKNRTPYSGYFAPYVCDDSYCLNGGKCRCQYHYNRLVQTCDCPEKFSGRRCQGLCLPSTCGQNGRCVTSGTADCQVAECICNSGYCGDQCEPSDKVTGQSCSIDAECLTNGAKCIEGLCRCGCDESFSGQFPLLILSLEIPLSKCLKDCPNGLSDEFSSNVSQVLNIDVEKIIANNITLEGCLQACVDEVEFVCRSISFFENQCALARTKSTEASLLFFPTEDGVTEYYERLCNSESEEEVEEWEEEW